MLHAEQKFFKKNAGGHRSRIYMVPSPAAKGPGYTRIQAPYHSCGGSSDLNAASNIGYSSL